MSNSEDLMKKKEALIDARDCLSEIIELFEKEEAGEEVEDAEAQRVLGKLVMTMAALEHIG